MTKQPNDRGRAPLAIVSTGLVTSVGLSAASSCAAIRAGVTNPVASDFIDATGEPFITHAVELDRAWRGRIKLVQMAALAIEECLDPIPRSQWNQVPVLLAVADEQRPGRQDRLDGSLLRDIAEALDTGVGVGSAVVPFGRAAIGLALRAARALIYDKGVPAVVIAGTDSLLSWPTLRAFEENDRLLTARNSNGFIPGEAGAAVLVTAERPSCIALHGVGLANEAAHLDSELPLRAEGLTAAIRAALSDADCGLHELDFRLTDISGEQYYFKEAALALSRTLRQPKQSFDLWHPAECIGEVGAAIGPVLLAVADAAFRKAYSAGPGILIHCANDGGERAALVARVTSS
jgi:3-oxoacyl-[acyl-carrier-protein] synthase-1